MKRQNTQTHRSNIFTTRSLFRVAGTAIIILLAVSFPAVAGVYYDSSINYYQDGAYVSVKSDGSDDSHISYQSFSGGVGSGWSIVNGESFGLTSGYADAANLSMGIKAQVISSPANSHLSDARISTEVSNRLTILPGSSGLAPGDVTTLTLKIKLDGSLHTEATSWPLKGWSHAEMDAGLIVHDYAIQEDLGGDGFWSPPQLSFGASCELESYDVYMPTNNHTYSSNWDKYWRFDTNLGANDSYSNSGGITQLGESFHYQEGFHFNTGELTLVFEAIVGHTLDFDANMYFYIDANNDAMTWADFNNTFAFNVTSAVDGLSLNWEVVPEPASLSLLAMGGLALLRSRKTGFRKIGS
jgi:hypothetical protein